MNNLEKELIIKLEIIDFKYTVTSIIHSLQFDGVYRIEHCIEDLNKLLKHLDESEAPYYLILRNSKQDELVEREKSRREVQLSL